LNSPSRLASLCDIRRISQDFASLFLCGQCGLGAIGNQPAFLLSEAAYRCSMNGSASRPSSATRKGTPAVPASANPLQTDKLLDAKVRPHRKLIEEVNLQALKKLPENEMHGHIQKIVSQYVLAERLALNSQELNDFVAEIIDELTGLGPLEPLLKDPSISDILITATNASMSNVRARTAWCAFQG